jgi:hypothetical protein
MISLINKTNKRLSPRTGLSGLAINGDILPVTPLSVYSPGNWNVGGTTWVDSVGTNNLTASTALSSFGSLNGYTTASLANGLYLKTTSLNINVGNPGVTTVLVTQMPANEPNYSRLAVYATNTFSGDDYNSTSAFVALAKNATNLQVASEYLTPFYSTVTLPRASQWVIIVNRTGGAGGNCTNSWYSYGNTSGITALSISGPTFTANQLLIGSGLGAGASTPWGGPIAEAAIFNSYLSDANLASVVSYYRNKFAIV